MIEAMQHSCTIARSTVDKRLAFDAGSAVFTVGKILTGATSHATGTVKTVTKSTGDWAGGTAAGYLVLSNVSGIFADNEAISDPGAIISRYPPEQNATYVKATTYATGCWPYLSTDPTKSLIGTPTGKEWASGDYVVANQRFHIDLGSAKQITRIYYENSHYNAANGNKGVRETTFWGSNDPTSFAELTFGVDTGWTELPISQYSFDEHIDLDQPDPKYLTVTNVTAYRYYAFKIANNYGRTSGMGVRRIELQGGDPGAALANGASVDNGDDYGVRSAVTSTTTVKCRFVNPKGGMKKLESGEHIYNLPAVVLPSGTTIAEGDVLTGVTSGFTRAYRVMHVRTIQADEGISHIRCDLDAVT